MGQMRSIYFYHLQDHEREYGKYECQPRHLAESVYRYFVPCAINEAGKRLLSIHRQGVDVPGRVLRDPGTSISLGTQA